MSRYITSRTPVNLSLNVDHVVPFHSPEGTAAEWIEDPFGNSGYVYTGPGNNPLVLELSREI